MTFKTCDFNPTIQVTLRCQLLIRYFRGPLGSVGGPSGVCMGAIGGPLGGRRRPDGVHWGPLGSCWGPLGWSLLAWAPLGSTGDRCAPGGV